MDFSSQFPEAVGFCVDACFLVKGSVVLITSQRGPYWGFGLDNLILGWLVGLLSLSCLFLKIWNQFLVVEKISQKNKEGSIPLDGGVVEP